MSGGPSNPEPHVLIGALIGWVLADQSVTVQRETTFGFRADCEYAISSEARYKPSEQ